MTHENTIGIMTEEEFERWDKERLRNLALSMKTVGTADEDWIEGRDYEIKKLTEDKMENTSGIRPTEFKVLVKPKEIGDKIGSVYIPEEAKEREEFAQMEGVVIDMSPHAFTYESWVGNHVVFRPDVGDRVLFSKYAGATWKGKDGEMYRLVSDKDIAAILED